MKDLILLVVTTYVAAAKYYMTDLNDPIVMLAIVNIKLQKDEFRTGKTLTPMRVASASKEETPGGTNYDFDIEFWDEKRMIICYARMWVSTTLSNQKFLDRKCDTTITLDASIL